MNDKKSMVLLVLTIVSICISVICLILCLGMRGAVKEVTESTTEAVTEAASEEGDVQYVLYLGTNDKDTNDPVFEPDEAKEILKGILISRFGGYTIQEANGGWIDDDGTEYQEYTLMIYLSDTSSEDVHALCDELIDKYNQSAVLIQENQTKTEFYSKD